MALSGTGTCWRALRHAVAGDRPRRLLLGAVLVHLLMMGSLFWGYLDPLFDNTHSLPQGVDFFSVYEAGNSALENRSVYHFDPADVSVTPDHNPFRYLPVVAYAVAAPLTALPAWHAYWAWAAFYEVLLVACAYATWRVAGRGTWGCVGAAMWVVFTPFYVEQYVGQFSFLMAALFLFAGVGIARGRELAAGIPWAVSLVTKTNSALALPVFVRLGWWRSVAIGAGLVALNLSYYAARPRDLWYFLWLNLHQVLNAPGLGFLEYEARVDESRFLADPDQRFLQFSAGEQSLVGLVRNAYLAVDSTAANLPGSFALLMTLAVIAVAVAATFFSRKNDMLVIYCIWLSTFFLFYTAWEHHYVMLLPVLVLLVALRPSARVPALATFVLVALPSPYWLVNAVTNTSLPPSGSLLSVQESWPVWGVVLHHAVKPLAVLALWGYLVGSQLRPSGGREKPHPTGGP